MNDSSYVDEVQDMLLMDIQRKFFNNTSGGYIYL
jgi:hypothetical protein